LLFAAATLILVPGAVADDWLPHPADATWTYQWSDTAYNPTPTKEKVTVGSSVAAGFTLDWTTDGLDNADSAPTSTGTVSFRETNSGLEPTSWSSSPPPASFPVLCASQNPCSNSLASTYLNAIWGALRSRMLEEPLLQGSRWTSSGGTQNDVSSSSQYLGVVNVSGPITVNAVYGFTKGFVAAGGRASVAR
jgi:hypothetical protein